MSRNGGGNLLSLNHFLLNPRPMKTLKLLLLLICGLSPGIGLAQSDGLPRGAYDAPYTRYESEDATRGGGAVLRTSPAFVQTDVASEASNQKYVALPTSGSSVSWPIARPGAGVDLRFTIPDAASGGGVSGSLNLYVNGVLVRTISLSSYWSWQYFANGSGDPINTPGGRAFMRFDEVHFRLNTRLNAGDVVKIQKDNNDAYEYGVDFIEVEDVPAAVAKPAGYLSVTDYGATPNDGTDDINAFNSCLAAAKAAGTGMYIPEGTFTLAATWRPEGSGFGIKGAGMWYSNINFSTNAYFSGGILARVSNVEISGIYFSTANNARQENGQARIYKCFMGTYGTGSYIHDIWEEHFECGFWIGGYDPPYPAVVTTNFRVSHNRIRNNYADGCNFAQGTNNSTVEFCSVRNNGDDGIASWSSTDAGVTTVCSNLEFKNNTIENNWRAGGIGVFGGANHRIHHNTVKDAIGGSGIRFTTEFPGNYFETNTNMQVYEMTITACGTSTDLFNQERGAIDMYAANAPVKNITFSYVDIINAQRNGVQFGPNTIDNIKYNSITINGTGRDNETKSVYSSAYDGYAVFSFAGTGTSTFTGLALSNIASNPPTYKTQSGYNLIINTAPPVAVTSVTVTPSSATVQQQQTVQLTATVSPSNATDQSVSWTSSNTAVATVSATGLVTAVGGGTATITATTTSGGFKGTSIITVPASTPTISSAGTASGTAGVAFSYTITASQSPTSFGATGLPAGLSVNTSTGVISGTVNTAGTYNFTVSATNGAGTSTKAVTLTISTVPPCTAPVIGYTSTAPVIDQSIDAAWSNVPAGTLNKATIGSMPADFAGSRWRAMYDATNLYVLVEVKDNAKYSDSGASWWEDDVVELFIDGNNSKGTTYDGVNDFQLGFRYNDGVVNVGGNSVNRTAGIVFAIQNVNGGYNLEAKIPWTTIGVTPQVGNQLGFDIAVDDDDNGGTRDAQVTAFAATSNGFASPSVFGSVYLTTCNGGSTSVAVTGVSVTPASASLAVGATQQLSATVAPSNATNKNVSWTSSNTSVATVNSNGLVTAVASGTATITATTQDGGKTASSTITVTTSTAPGTLSVSKTASTITINGQLTEASWQLNQSVNKTTVGTPNNTVTFGVLWDNTNLYIGAKVLDASLFADSPDAWNDDGIEVYIDANNNKLGSYDGADNQIIKNFNKSTVSTKVAISGLQHAWAAISGGYSVEMAIPWSQLGINAPAAGTTIGFDLGYDDDDNGADRDGQAVWNGTVNNYASTAAFGSLVLSSTTSRGALASKEVTAAGEPSVSCWPSIVERELNVRTDGSYTTVTVYDLLGRVQHHDDTIAGKTSLTLNLGKLTSGAHLVKLISPQTTTILRIVKK
jgi:uncharacterized protein YjdB